MVIEFRKTILSCIIINFLSLVVFVSGGRSYGELYLGAIEIFGMRSILGVGLAVINITVCILFLKKRRALIGEIPIKCSKLGAVFGILAAIFTVIFQVGFIPFASGGWDWIQGNLTGLLFVLPIFHPLIVMGTLFFIVAQLGFYLTAIIQYILLFSKMKDIS